MATSFMSLAGKRVQALAALLSTLAFFTFSTAAFAQEAGSAPYNKLVSFCSLQTVACVRAQICPLEVAEDRSPLPQVAAVAFREGQFMASSPSATPKSPQSPLSENKTETVSADTVFRLINERRAIAALPPFHKDEKLCALAASRAREMVGEIENGALHSGLYKRNLPYWVTEDAKYGSDEAETVNWWMNSPLHRSAILGNFTYSCGACNGTYCSELFTNYEAK